MCFKLLFYLLLAVPDHFFFLTFLLICNKSDFLYAVYGMHFREIGLSSLIALVLSEIWTFCSSEYEPRAMNQCNVTLQNHER